MASYDFIECSASAYKYVWTHRMRIARMAAFALVVKFGCMVAVFALQFEDHYLRQGLILVPAYFAEGAFLARMIQTMMADGPGRGLYPEPRLIRAAMVLYVLIKVAAAFIGGAGVTMVEINAEGGMEQSSPALVLAALLFLAASVWAFRLFWLYVPVALGYRLKDFLARIQGIGISFYMLGTWLICFLPLALMLVVIVTALGDLFGHAEDTPSVLYRFAVVGIQAVIDLLASLLASLAMALAVRHIMTGEDDAGLWDEEY